MRLAQDSDVVHTFTPDRSDQPFDKLILPRRGWRGAEKAEIQRAAHLSDPVTIDLKADEKEAGPQPVPLHGLDEIAPCAQLRVKAIMLLPR